MTGTESVVNITVVVADLHAPGDLAPELVLGLAGDLDAALAGLLAEPLDVALLGGGPLGVGQALGDGQRGSVPTTVISSRSTTTSGRSVNQFSGRRWANHSASALMRNQHYIVAGESCGNVLTVTVF